MDSTASTWKDEDLVYVDPETSTVVGPVEWSKNGNPKPMPIVQIAADDKEGRRRGWRKFYPWGTYKSMKAACKVGGKVRKKEPTKTLDEVIEVALKEPYWD
jgi:hypothetical protein